MLDELHVSDIALIEDVTLAFSPHLTVLTGETGAGKTALLTALKLICGARADASVVRDGEQEALAEARLIADEEHIVKRRLSAAGRSRCSIDGAMATVGELASATSSIEVHGQHEQVLLLDPARQLAYLDAWAGDGGKLQDYRNARTTYLEAHAAYEELLHAADKNVQELDYLRYTYEQIQAVDPQKGELEFLEEELPRLQNAEQLRQSLEETLGALHDDNRALDLIAQACSSLADLKGIDQELDGIAHRLDDQLLILEDLVRDLNSYAQSIDVDPYRLEETLARLEKLSGLMRRFGPTMEQVFNTWEKAKLALDAADGDPIRLDEARQDLEQAEIVYRKAARELSDVRRTAALHFCDQLVHEVQELAMDGAGFEFSFAELPFERWNDTGSEQIELLYQPSRAASAKPLKRIASGGELSRILLALESMHYAAESTALPCTTIVFDEVDSGIGGAAGEAVARKLDALASSVQVIVVTHLAQVAALADAHYVVHKQNIDDSLPQTSVTVVSGEDRVREIARMLSGSQDDVALEHARSLLEGAKA